MQLTGKEDLRVQKTIAVIHQAFDEMIQEMEFRRMTVTELCQRAKINKKTFYRYYQDMDLLLEERQAEVAAECLKYLSLYRIPEQLEDLLRSQFYIFRAHDGLNGKIMCCQGGGRSFFEKIRQMTNDRYWEGALQELNCSPNQKAMLLWFIHLNLVAFYRSWIANGEQEDLDEMIHTAAGLICNGVQGYLPD